MGKKHPKEAEIPSLCKVYSPFFPIGAAINLKTLETHSELLKKHFNSITPENHLKWQFIHPLPGKYNFDDANRIIDFAIENNMKVRGHTLIWHHSVPDWVFKGEDGKLVDKKTLFERLQEHIEIVIGYYKGKIYAWDVVNEAISDRENEFLRDELWYKIGGEEIIEKAFIWAYKVDPDVVLFYNDYNLELPEKRKKAFDLIKRLKEKGIPVGGVGIQGHWGLAGKIKPEDLKETIETFIPLGIDIQITELDISIYLDKNEKFNHPEEVAPERFERQAELYEEIFKIAREYKEVITGVTFWGVADDLTWLDFFPTRGRKDFPLLFDINHQPKKSFWQVINF